VQHRRQQPSHTDGPSHVDDIVCRQRQAATSSRYIDAQRRNRMELVRLNERRRTLDRQRRSASSVIDQSKRKFAAEMADVTRTTSSCDLAAVGRVVPVTCDRRRRRRATTAAEASAAVSRHDWRYVDGLDDSVTPAVAALRLYDDRDVDRTRQCRHVNRTRVGGVRSELTAASNPATDRILSTRRGSTCGNINTVSATIRACQSAAGHSTLARQDFRCRRLPTFSYASRPNSFLSDTAERGASVSRTRSATDFAANAEKQETAEVEGTDADREREVASRWRRDLRREAPPALYGYRPTLNFHAVMSQAERRRRLVALQTRQRALLLHITHAKLS